MDSQVFFSSCSGTCLVSFFFFSSCQRLSLTVLPLDHRTSYHFNHSRREKRELPGVRDAATCLGRAVGRRRPAWCFRRAVTERAQAPEATRPPVTGHAPGAPVRHPHSSLSFPFSPPAAYAVKCLGRQRMPSGPNSCFSFGKDTLLQRGSPDLKAEGDFRGLRD